MRAWCTPTCTSPRSHEGVVHTDVHIAEVNEAGNGECFDPETCCDARERALIEALRAYLRPEQAPECLLTRLSGIRPFAVIRCLFATRLALAATHAHDGLLY